MPTYRITNPETGQTIKIDGPAPPSEAVVRQMFQQIAAKTPTPPRPTVDLGQSVSRAVGVGPMAGATVGAIAGGVPGAAIGGAAGTGYEQLVRHAKEVPGAVRDVASGLMEHPAETLRGAKEGIEQGLADTGVSAAVNAGLEAGGQALMGGLQKAGRAVYRGYLKPSLAGHSIKDAQQIVQTALDEALPISGKGVTEANRVIGELKSKVDGILAQRSQLLSKIPGGTIDLHDIANEVRQFARDAYYKAGRPVEDFEAALRVADNIDAHPALNLPPGSVPGPQPASVAEANTVKRTLQNSAGDRAFGVERSAATEAEKKGAFLLRKEVEKLAPDVGPLNARESKLIDAAKAIAHAVEREANQNALVGVKSVLAAGAGGAEYGRTGDPWSAAAKALALRYAMSPAAASQLAVMAYRIGKLPGIAPASAARLALAALSSEKVAHDEQREK